MSGRARAGLTLTLLLLGLTGAGCASVEAVPDDDSWRSPRDHKPVWSPDGTRIAFHRSDWDGLFVVTVRTGAERQLLNGVTWNDGYMWSPDGRFVAATSRRDGVRSERCYTLGPCPELYLVPVGAGRLRRLTSNRTDEHAPRVSPDGRYVAYLGNRPPEDPRAWRDVYLADVERRTTRRLTDDAVIEQDLDWERGGRALIVVDDHEVWFRLFLDGRRESFDGPSPWRPSRSSNGTVAYLTPRDRNGRNCGRDSDGNVHCNPNSELYLRLASGRRLRVTHSRVTEMDPTWSPDGRTLVFSSGGRLFLVDADGSHLRKLTG